MSRPLPDIIGHKFGLLAVISYNGIKNSQSSWNCLCECGNKTIVLNSRLKSGNTSSCGCLQIKRAFESNLIDYVGKKFGLLTAISYAETRNKNAYWNCLCECGKKCTISANALKIAKSCGCRQGNFKHGEWSKGLANYAIYRRKNPLVKLQHNVSSSIRAALKSIGESKIGEKTFNNLPYSAIELKQHIESLWEPWMNWENYGGTSDDPRKTWHIDHIIPHKDFPYKSLKDPLFVECWSLNNLRPLDKKENMSKSNKHI